MHADTHLLSSVEVDGRQIAFEHGLLLSDPGADEHNDCWHIMLLRLPLDEVLCAAPASGQQHTVRAITLHGERLSGRARPLSFRSAPDCLRLIGTSALLWAAEQVDSPREE